VRGLRRKAKAEEAARQAGFRGLAIDEQIQIVKNACQVGINGNFVARENGMLLDEALSSNMNGQSHDDAGDDNNKQLDKDKQLGIRDSQDISLHNLNDYRE